MVGADAVKAKVGDIVTVKATGERMKVTSVGVSSYTARRFLSGGQVEIWTDGNGKITRARACP